jgi:tetratricopeptide (TPR) repeat protein
VPLPGGATQLSQAHAAGGFDFPETTEGAAQALDDVPDISGVDFAEVPDEPLQSAPTRTAGPAQSMDFSDLPSPAGAPAPIDDFAAPLDVPDLPMPAEQNLPSPAGSGFDFNMPSPAAPSSAPNPASAFGEVDLDSGSESSELEFDPTAKPKVEDELEADLSAPLQSTKPAAPADGLEMLSFIDETAKEHGVKETAPVRRFHIKRRSGKVFGPFEEAVVIKMLEEGQLLGNEEVSADAETWHPIGTEGAFQGAIAKLMEQPARAAAAAGQTGGAAMAGGIAGAGNKPPPPSMERLKQLYEGRMAAVAVVEGKDPVTLKQRLPLIIGGMVVLIIAGTGVYTSQTRYGLFGTRVLFPARVSSNSEEFRTLAEAKKLLLADTFKAFKTAKEDCDKLLRIKQYPEARAVWMQSVYYLDRRYGVSSAADLSTAEGEQENILLLGEKNAEVVKAQAGAALKKKDYDRVLTLVGAARARSDNEGDLELLFLNAEGLTGKGQLPQAMTALKSVLDKDKTSARALHAMGLLHLKQKEFDPAAARFNEALAANPDHASSAVELAAIELDQHKDVTKGAEALEKALTDSAKATLAPSELGRALAMKAQVLQQQKKVDEALDTFEAALKADPTNVYAKAAYGIVLNERHDFAKAAPMLKDASEKSPENLAYVEAYLNALVGTGKMDDAQKLMATAEKRFPGNARMMFLSGRVEDGLDRTKNAEDYYKKAIAADPKMVEANIELAELYLRLRRFSEAKPQLDAAMAQAPDNPQVHVGYGEMALVENDIETADKELRKAADLNSNLPGVFLGLSKVALAKGKLEAAETHAQRALKIDPKIDEGRLQLGTVLWKLKHYDDAIKELEQAKEDDPRSVAVPVTLGAVNFDKGDLDAATSNLLTALQKDAGSAEANFYMAKVKNKRSEHTQAIEYMKKALDHSPRRPDFHYWLGNIYQDARKPNEAVDEWKAALTLDPKYADVLEALGRVSHERGKYKDAIDYYERTLAVEPSRTRVQAAIGESYFAMEKWDKAISAYQKTLETDPSLNEVFPKLGRAYQEKNKWSDAIIWYRKATEADPKNGQAWQDLGFALVEKHKKQEAIEAFKHFLEVNTDPKQAKEIKDRILELGGKDN